MQFNPVWQSWIFNIITPVFSVTWSFRNHSNMSIWSSKKCLIINVENSCVWLIEKRLFEIEIYWNIINGFTVTFDECIASLLNQSIHFFQRNNKSYWPETDCVLICVALNVVPCRFWFLPLTFLIIFPGPYCWAQGPKGFWLGSLFSAGWLWKNVSIFS